MYDTIQNLLTYLIEAITIIGFCGCWVHYSLTTVLNEIASWGNPQQPQQSMQNKARESGKALETLDVKEFPTLQKQWELESDMIMKNNSNFLNLNSLAQTKQEKNTTPNLQGYSKTRLRKVARELQIRRYSQMEIPELMTAIAAHLETQRISV